MALTELAPIRVLVVDDSVVVRRILTDVLAEDPAIEVVGTAVNGRAALARIAQLRPDLVVMDVEMPEMDGIAAVVAIRAGGLRTPVVMFSTLTARGAAATLDALAAGADDYVTKPAGVGSIAQSRDSVRDQLVPRIKALTGRPSGRPGNPQPSIAQAPRTGPRKAPAVLVVGASTGGPDALSRVIPALPADFPLPVLVVQHMPPVFTTQFAARLDRLSALSVVEATAGVPLRAGTVHIAPGDFHLGVSTASGLRCTQLDQAVPENYCRPAVDVLFRSAAAAYDGAVLGVVLTGMGSDGRNGTREVRAAGGTVIAQDQATSVVWGMPGSVVRAGQADEVVELDQVAGAVLRSLGAGRPVLTGVRA